MYVVILMLMRKMLLQKYIEHCFVSVLLAGAYQPRMYEPGLPEYVFVFPSSPFDDYSSILYPKLEQTDTLIP